MKRKLLTFVLFMTFAAEALPQAMIAHPWQGKRVAYFGDSITDPRNSGSKKKYWGFLEDWLQITPYVYGVSGRQWNDIPRQTDQLKQQHGQDVDAILIFCGTNDYNNGVPVGQWWDERVTEVEYGHGQVKQMVTRRQRTPSMDPTTYKGRINIALDSLKRTFPTKQIVLLTPIHRSDFHANEKNWQCDESYTNQCGEYLDDRLERHLWPLPVAEGARPVFPQCRDRPAAPQRPGTPAHGPHTDVPAAGPALHVLMAYLGASLWPPKSHVYAFTDWP